MSTSNYSLVWRSW